MKILTAKQRDEVYSHCARIFSRATMLKVYVEDHPQIEPYTKKMLDEIMTAAQIINSRAGRPRAGVL